MTYGVVELAELWFRAGTWLLSEGRPVGAARLQWQLLPALPVAAAQPTAVHLMRQLLMPAQRPAGLKKTLPECVPFRSHKQTKDDVSLVASERRSTTSIRGGGNSFPGEKLLIEILHFFDLNLASRRSWRVSAIFHTFNLDLYLFLLILTLMRSQFKLLSLYRLIYLQFSSQLGKNVTKFTRLWNLALQRGNSYFLNWI